MLIDALGETAEPLDLADLRQGFTKGAERAATSEDIGYYASTEPRGERRLLDHLQESAFWSKHLYSAAAGTGLVFWIGILALTAMVGVFAQPFLSAPATLVFSRGVALVLTFVSATDGITRALDWLASAQLAGAVDRRLEAIRPGQQEALLAIFADYGVATTFAAPIPGTVYRAEKARLERLWRDRKGLVKPG